MLKVKELNNDLMVENDLNKWLSENSDKKIVDIKYSADVNSSNVLIVYKEDK